LIGTAAMDFGGKRERGAVVVGSRCVSMAQWTESKSRCPVPVVDMEEVEIELLFEQLWNIPQHLAKPPQRGAAHIKPPLLPRVHSPPSPPPLPPERPALC
jgi:hypothetical protein